jgi:hypothetical protein
MSKKWETEFDCELGTGILKIEYEFDPGEKEVTYYPDGSGSPGTSPSVRIIKMSVELDNPDTDFVEQLEAE